jgi:excisionase family DNA binding protein
VTQAAANTEIDLQTAADRLGVHYQTAYQWVRAGERPAHRVRGRYSLDPKAVDALRRRRSRPAPPRVRRPRDGFGALADQAAAQLRDGDERALRQLVGRLLDDGVAMTTIAESVLAPGLRRIGEEWHAGRARIVTEHRATAMVERILGEHLPRPRGRPRGTAVIAALSGDRHALPTLMAATALREDHWQVEHLGADLPPEELVAFVEEHRPALVVLTVTNPKVARLAERTAAQLEALEARVLIGGPGRTLTELQHEARGENAHPKLTLP